MEYVKPVLPCPGNKFKLLPNLLPHFPEDIRIFFDMFAGTGSVFLNVDSEITCINEGTLPLSALLITMTNKHPEHFMDIIEDAVKEYNITETNKKGYIRLRSDFNKTKNPYLLFLLITTSFANLIRFNQKGNFNVPIAGDRTYTRRKYSDKLYQFYNRMLEKGILDSESNLFMSVKISNLLEHLKQEFEEVELTDRDFFYADPPYLISTSPWKWKSKEEKQLLEVLSWINEKGAKFGLSNWLETEKKENTILKQWISDNNFRVIYINDNNMYDNSFNKKGTRVRKNKEVLVVNY